MAVTVTMTESGFDGLIAVAVLAPHGRANLGSHARPTYYSETHTCRHDHNLYCEREEGEEGEAHYVTSPANVSRAPT